MFHHRCSNTAHWRKGLPRLGEIASLQKIDVVVVVLIEIGDDAACSQTLWQQSIVGVATEMHKVDPFRDVGLPECRGFFSFPKICGCAGEV